MRYSFAMESRPDIFVRFDVNVSPDSQDLIMLLHEKLLHGDTFELVEGKHFKITGLDITSP